MPEWLTQAFSQYSLFWFLLSSIVGGFIGASIKFIFDTFLPQWVKDRREIIATKRKYQTPILLAADELRWRLRTIIERIEEIETGGWAADKTGYYYLSSVYAAAHFFGWNQILRRTIIYLDFTKTEETKTFENFLTAIRRGFISSSFLGQAASVNPSNSEDKWIFDYWLRAVSEEMLVKEAAEYRVKEFSKFSIDLQKPENASFKKWIEEIGSIFINIKKNDARFRRIAGIHAVLNAYINYADPKHLRAERHDYYWQHLKKEEQNAVMNLIKSIAPSLELE